MEVDTPTVPVVVKPDNVMDTKVMEPGEEQIGEKISNGAQTEALVEIKCDSVDVSEPERVEDIPDTTEVTNDTTCELPQELGEEIEPVYTESLEAVTLVQEVIQQTDYGHVEDETAKPIAENEGEDDIYADLSPQEMQGDGIDTHSQDVIDNLATEQMKADGGTGDSMQSPVKQESVDVSRLFSFPIPYPYRFFLGWRVS